MNVLDDLIRIKTNKQEDDLLKLLDEIPVYEKLSVDDKLKDLAHSDITRRKCPLLAGFTDGHLYETVLADLAANVYLQIEGEIPIVLQTASELSQKKQKQLEILQKGIATVNYRDLMDYDHKVMKALLTAVFIKKHGNVNIAALIVKQTGGYTMFHGTYTADEKGKAVSNTNGPLAIKGKKGVFAMDSYSVLGNNGYPFARYSAGNLTYDVMISPEGVLYLMNGALITSYELHYEDRNTLNTMKKDPNLFAKELTEIIERVVQV